MKYFVLLGFVLALVLGQQCGGTSCSECTATAGCGWCSSTQTCMKGNATGPTEGYCLNAWDAECPNCGIFSGSCRECLTQASCTWDGVNGCVPLSPTIPRTCPCADFTDCNSCNYESPQSSCSWCESPSGSSCIPSSTACAGGILAHTCPCNSVSACATCASTENCVWCGSAAKVANSSCVDAGSCDASDLTCSEYCAAANGDCAVCNMLPGCAYCENQGTCTDENTLPPGCLRTHTCPWLCPTEADCVSCNMVSGCTWCDGTRCVPINEAHATCSEVSLSCMIPVPPPPGKKGFSAGSFVGGMFLMLGLVGLLAGGFAFYRRKKTSASYEQVN